MTTIDTNHDNGDRPAVVHITSLPVTADASRASDGDWFGELTLAALAVFVVLIAIVGFV